MSGLAEALVAQVVLFGMIAAELDFVPLPVFSISTLKAAVASAPTKLAILTPTDTTLTVSEAPIPESAALNRSSAFNVDEALYVVASSGVCSPTRVKLLTAPDVPPTCVANAKASPASLALR